MGGGYVSPMPFHLLQKCVFVYIVFFPCWFIGASVGTLSSYSVGSANQCVDFGRHATRAQMNHSGGAWSDGIIS